MSPPIWASLNLAKFDPKAPPPKTAAFWDIVDAGNAAEDAELADMLDGLKRPDAVTLAQIKKAASGDFEEWLSDRKNWRSMPHRMERCGYTPFRNNDADDGLWRVQGKRQTIYVKATLPVAERARAAEKLR
jgi:hypothetical protein